MVADPREDIGIVAPYCRQAEAQRCHRDLFLHVDGDVPDAPDRVHDLVVQGLGGLARAGAEIDLDLAEQVHRLAGGAVLIGFEIGHLDNLVILVADLHELRHLGPLRHQPCSCLAAFLAIKRTNATNSSGLRYGFSSIICSMPRATISSVASHISNSRASVSLLISPSIEQLAHDAACSSLPGPRTRQSSRRAGRCSPARVVAPPPSGRCMPARASP